MITRAYIQEYGNGKIEPEHWNVKKVLESRGISCELFTEKRVHRNQLVLDNSTLVVGDNPTIQSVLAKIGYTRKFSTYPESLRGYLKRSIRETTVAKLILEISSTDVSGIFIKPLDKSKLFTGFVVHSNNDLFKIFNYSKNTRIFVSSIVEWISEFRIFIVDSKIVGVKNYAGKPDVLVDMKVVDQAIIDLEKSQESTRGYSLDFGVLSNGETALIEWNDGYALGGYGLDGEIYTDLILARWNEIIQENAANIN
jgi:hypothetical protein